MNARTVTSQPISPIFYYFLAAIGQPTDPIHFYQALKYSHWIDAMNVELHALKANKTCNDSATT